MPGSAQRDFTQAKKDELLDLVREIEREPFWDITKYDVWYRSEQMAHKLLPGLLGNFAQARGYHRKILDINETSRREIEEIFDKAYEAQARHAATVQGYIDVYRSVDSALLDLANGIQV